MTKKIALTGDAGGIGLATARRFLKDGHTVVGIDQNEPESEWSASLSDDERSRFLHLTADLTDDSSRDAAVRSALSRLDGRVDTLILNHGVGANLDDAEGKAVVCTTATDFDHTDFMRVMDINFTSSVQLLAGFVGNMPKNDSSAIITASSIWSRGVLHYALPYAASKSALTTITRNWAGQFAPIRAVAVVLGGFSTPMLTTNPNGEQEVSKETLLGRPGTPEEVADTYHFIAHNNYITATDLVLDGGSMNR